MFSKLTAINEKLSPGLRRILGNVGWLFVEHILAMVLTFVVGIYVIRYLGSENFGKLSYSTSFAALFSTIATLGLNNIVVRNVVQEEKATSEILGTAFLLKFIASLATVVVISLAIWRFNEEPDIRWITLIIAGGLVFSAFDTIEFWFQSQVLGGQIALLRSVQLIVSSLAKLSFVALGLPLIAFVWLILADQVCKGSSMLWLYLQHHQSILQWRFNRARAIEMLRDSWPLILSGFMVTIYMKIDQVMLGNMASLEAVGNYAAAVRLSEVWYFIPGAICSSVFPAIIRARQRSQQEYYRRLQQLYDFMAWLAFSITIPMTFISVPLMTTLLGKEYAEAGEILAWHIWSSPFVFLGVARSQWLMAENFTQFSFLTTLLGAAVNMWLNFLLIPPYQGVGAAIATAISQAIASYVAMLIYPQTFNMGWMLTKALCVPLRFRQNLIYVIKLRKILLTTKI
jgi:O-antigen/teichoic acid export membrane protein